MQKNDFLLYFNFYPYLTITGFNEIYKMSKFNKNSELDYKLILPELDRKINSKTFKSFHAVSIKFYYLLSEPL